MTPMPNENKQDHLLEHSYDGIQEFDNPMPRWWIYLFWATIIFSILYLLNVRGRGRRQAQGRAAGRGIGGAARGDDEGRVRSGVRQAGVRPELRGLSPRRRRRPDWPEPHRRLLAPRRGPRPDPQDRDRRRARERDAAVEQGAEAQPARRGGRVRVHAPRHESPQPEGSPGRPGIAVSAPVAVGRVLPTLNEDGSRRWIRPKPSHGTYANIRRAVAYGLMLVFFLIPHVRMGGKPLVLLDIPRRQFTLFGTTFLPTDTLLLMLLLASIIIAIFLLTALF